MQSSIERIGVIGLGHMGSDFASYLRIIARERCQDGITAGKVR